MYDVRLKQPAELARKALEGQKTALSGVGVFFILDPALQGLHDAERLEARQAEPLDASGQTVSGTTPIPIRFAAQTRLDQVRHGLLDERFVDRHQRLDQGRESIRDGSLNDLGRGHQHFKQRFHDGNHLGIRGVQVLRGGPDANDCAEAHIVILLLGKASVLWILQISLHNGQNRFSLLSARAADHSHAGGHHRRAHVGIVVQEAVRKQELQAGEDILPSQVDPQLDSDIRQHRGAGRGSSLPRTSPRSPASGSGPRSTGRPPSARRPAPQAPCTTISGPPVRLNEQYFDNDIDHCRRNRAAAPLPHGAAGRGHVLVHIVAGDPDQAPGVVVGRCTLKSSAEALFIGGQGRQPGGSLADQNALGRRGKHR